MGDLDNDTRWAMGWFKENGFEAGSYGRAQNLFISANTSLGGVSKAGIATDAKGKVRLLRRDELPAGWRPSTDERPTVWEVTQHLVRTLDEHGEEGAAALLGECGRWADAARDLAQWLAATSLATGRSEEAQAQDLLVTSWSQLTKLAERACRARSGAESAQGAFEGVGTVEAE